MFHVKPLFVLIFLLPLISYSQHVGTSRLEIKDLPVPPSRDTAVDNYINRRGVSLNSTEKEWFYWTNYSRHNPRRFWDSVIVPILDLHPEFRNSYIISLKDELYKSPSLPLVKPNVKLAQVANQLASALAAGRSGPSHTDPSGGTFEARMQSINVRRCAGENISFGPPNTLLMLVLLFIDEGVADLGHRRTLLNPSFVEMGVGSSTYANGNAMVVTDFACSQE